MNRHNEKEKSIIAEILSIEGAIVIIVVVAIVWMLALGLDQ